jgi:uncharacterized protein (DUF488 family)
MQQLLNRQRLLLALTQELGDQVTATDFQKHLFLYTILCEKDRSYQFVPYHFGCFSFVAMQDRAKLIEKGYLKDAEGWLLRDSQINYVSRLPKDGATKLKIYVGRYSKLRGISLVRHTYAKYPYFAINSKIASDVLAPVDIERVEQIRPKRQRSKLLGTIGYEGIPIESYINKLILNDIRALVDVRRNAISRKYGFSKNTLARILKEFSIAYIHLPELGIGSDQRQSLNSAQDYEDLFDDYENDVLIRTPCVLNGLIEVLTSHRRIALTCFEGSSTMCHRGRIVDSLAKDLANDVAIAHL